MSKLPETTRNRMRAVTTAAFRFTLLVLIALSLFASFLPGSSSAQSAAPKVFVGKIDGEISPVMERYVKRAINRAERDDAAALVFKMDTPGGLSSAMDDIVRDILESKVPVVVYVAPRGARAASAGVYITYAAHIAAMAPGTNIGSASPIFVDSTGNVSDGSDTLKKKVTNDAVSQIVNLANLRGRNAQWAEQAVREAVNITADQAAQLKVVDLLAPDLTTLLNQINGRTVQLESGTVTLQTAGGETTNIDMSIIERFLQMIGDPTIAYLLLSLGLFGLYIELSHPGVSVPGIAGAIALLLGLFSLGSLPVDWTGVLLIGLGFVLLAVDLFVVSAGTLTIGGLISFILGSYLLFGPNAPAGYEVSPIAIWTIAACLLAFSLFLGAAVMKARLRPPAVGRQAMIGKIGIARDDLNPSGMVYVDGALWSAHVESGSSVHISKDSRVVVTAIDGLTLTIRPATAPDVASATQAEQKREVGDRTTVIPVVGSTRPT